MITSFVINAQKDCWDNYESCLVKIEIIKEEVNITKYDGSNLIEMDCTPLQENDRENVSVDTVRSQRIMSQRFIGIRSIILDGCHTPLNAYTYGLEYLPNCSNITDITIQSFHMDSLRQLRCLSSIPLQIKVLRFFNNEIAVVDQNSFESYGLLEVLEMVHNSLRSLHPKFLQNLQSLVALRIIDEPVLVIKFPEILQNTKLIDLHIETIKQMTADIFRSLPQTLKHIYIAGTVLDYDAIEVINEGSLNNLTIVKCFLRSIYINDTMGSLEYINLSYNNLKNFKISKNNLHTLDLSHNDLETLPLEWLRHLNALHHLVLKGNYIKVLLLYEILENLPQIKRLDIRANCMQSLKNLDQQFSELTLSRLRLLSDRNPWDCLWLHSFAHNHPEMFRILQYDKFISKINVNGLECIPSGKLATIYEPIQRSLSSTSTPVHLNATDQVLNVSAYTIIYGNPWEFKRNQRAEALIIVFMLPLGIALLFLLLYLWIYCQKVFHLSYYQNFNCSRRPEQGVLNSAEEFSSLQLAMSSRSLAAYNQANDNYEEVKNMPSICNSNHKLFYYLIIVVFKHRASGMNGLSDFSSEEEEHSLFEEGLLTFSTTFNSLNSSTNSSFFLSDVVINSLHSDSFLEFSSEEEGHSLFGEGLMTFSTRFNSLNSFTNSSFFLSDVVINSLHFNSFLEFSSEEEEHSLFGEGLMTFSTRFNSLNSLDYSKEMNDECEWNNCQERRQNIILIVCAKFEEKTKNEAQF
uniref:LRRCT domain-containing protein n=1 Tax=Glossina brevipalpis TaxID=37001 RepID=A0A1A9WKR4_9MUSC